MNSYDQDQVWPITIPQIQRLQIESTSFCNANCPSCERYKYPYEKSIYNRPLNTNFITYQNVIDWFDFASYKNLKEVHFCGNIDEPTLNPDLLPILNHISTSTPDHTKIFVSTNGGTKNKLFWQSLAQLPKVVTIWGIDGLEDTNHIYRQNVKWDKLMENISYYMNVGGRGAWQFIVFEHNKHQLDMARLYADDLGFFGFLEVNSRKPNPKTPEVKIDKRPESSCVTCKATYENSDLGQGFFIDVKGNVWPCCWMGTHEESNKVAIKYLQSQGQMIFDDTIDAISESQNKLHNLHEHSLEDIISSEFYKFLHLNMNDLNICNEKCRKEMVDEIHWNI
tara:strand:- start:74 stop:1084 length:1011 start_codon:yes stop_codon:yes gene_type:complete